MHTKHSSKVSGTLVLKSYSSILLDSPQLHSPTLQFFSLVLLDSSAKKIFIPRIVHFVKQHAEPVRVSNNSDSTPGRLGVLASLRSGASPESSQPLEFALFDFVRWSEQQRPGVLVRDDAASARRLSVLHPVWEHDARPPGLYER